MLQQQPVALQAILQDLHQRAGRPRLHKGQRQRQCVTDGREAERPQGVDGGQMIENHWSCLTRTRGQLGASPHSVKLYLFFYSWLQNLVTVLLFLLFLIFTVGSDGSMIEL